MKEFEAYPYLTSHAEGTALTGGVIQLENTGWVEKFHPTHTDNRVFDPQNNESLYYWKKENDFNEPYVELLANQFANSLSGLHVAPTFIATFKGNIGITSAAPAADTSMLGPNTYQSFQNWHGSAFVSKHVVFNLWIANNDWGMDRFDNSYAVTIDSAGDFVSAYGIDFGHSLFCPPLFYQGNLGSSAIEFLSNNFVYSQSGSIIENNFFGIQIFLRHPNEGLETLLEIEGKTESFIYDTCQSVAQFLGKKFQDRKKYYTNLAEASSKVLIERKRKLRNWLQKEILLPNKHLLGV